VSRPELPTGTVTFLFTDIEGSTRLLHALGPAAYASALERHREVLREAFAVAGGVEVDTQGDAFFVVFDTPAGAARAAAAAHAGLAGGPVFVRIGLHTGSPLVSGSGYVGDDVHLGARIAALAGGGQTLVSAATAALLAGAELRDLGLHRLKDFEDATRVYQLGPGEFPPVRSPGSVDLPAPATPFLGRECELLEAISVVLEDDPRILTIVGAGGMGKTRFALELARLCADEAEGGTVFVPLAALRDPAYLLATVADRLGAASADVAAITARVGLKRTHLVIDNVEQLLPDAAPAIAALAAAAPALRLLVTSREALRVDGETQFELPPMVEDDAVELFLTRARAVSPGTERTAAVVELCERLDQLPLAVELAAARTKLLPPEALLERLGARLDLLRGARDADHRHATLRATIAWSYDLLAPDERHLLAQLAVFRAGWTIEVAEEVCAADIDTVAALLDKSLVRRRVDGRFFMFETIREFALERLREIPELDERVRRRHAERMLEVARAARLSSETFDDVPDYELVPAEREDFRSALDWTDAHDPVLAAEILTALEQFWVMSAPVEGAQRIDALLEPEAVLPPVLRARLLRTRGSLLILKGESGRGERDYEEALELFREQADERGRVALLARLMVNASQRDDPDAPRRIAEVRALNETVRHPAVEPQILAGLAMIAYRARDVEGALELSHSSSEASAACGFGLWELWQLAWQLELELELGRVDSAEATGRRALALAARRRDQRILRYVLTGLALVALRRGDADAAGRLWGAVTEAESEAALLAMDTGFAAFAAPLHDRSDPEFAAAVEVGRSVPLTRTIAAALE